MQIRLLKILEHILLKKDILTLLRNMLSNWSYSKRSEKKTKRNAGFEIGSAPLEIFFGMTHPIDQKADT